MEPSSSPKAVCISVCVPTFKRPRMLLRCLNAIANQEAVPVAYSVVVVDNDPEHSARIVVEQCSARFPGGVRYVHVPRPNISIARNAAVANAEGAYLAFIDDDEYPEPTWLSSLYKTVVSSRADGVLGPVLPHYTGSPPSWLVKSGLCDRQSFPTGTLIVESKHLRAGNVLLARKMFQDIDVPFDPALGRTGGEDADFLARMIARGSRFVWCEEARVFEEVPPERQKFGYYMRRALLRGVTEAEREPFFSYGTLKSLVAVVLYTLALPFLLLTQRHLFVLYSAKLCDHAGKLLAQFGTKPVRVRVI